MKTFKRFAFAGLGLLIVGSFQNCGKFGESSFSSVGGLGRLEEESLRIRRTNCAACHEAPNVQAEPSQILNEQFLIDNGWIVPGDAASSPLFISLLNGMPKGRPALSPADKDTLEQWIVQLGNTYGVANVTITDGPAFSFGALTTGNVAEHAFTLTNTGSATALGLNGSGLSTPYAFKGGSFPGTGGTCIPVLPATSSCTVVVEYHPVMPGTHTDTLEIGYLSGATVKLTKRDLTGSSTGYLLASLALNPTPSYNYGTVIIGQSASKTVSVTNTGSAAASSMAVSGLSAPFAFKGGAYPGTGGTCGTTLAVGASCTMVLDFTPTVSGPHSSTLNFAYNNAMSSLTITLDLLGGGAGGAGIYYSAIRPILASSCLACHTDLMPPSWGITYGDLRAFKKDTQATPAIVPADLNSRFITRISGNTGGAQMGAGIYGSLSATDRQKIIDWIASGALNDPTFTPAVLSLSGAPTVGFGNVIIGSTASQTITISNSGGSPALVMNGAGLAAPFAFAGGSYPGTAGTCSATLMQGTTCTIVVTFSPSSATASTDSVQINYNDGVSAKMVERAVSGTGMVAPTATLTIAGPAIDFGLVITGSVVPRTITITNAGAATASAINMSGLSGAFRFKGGSYPGTGGTCATTLAASASCTVVIEYAPTASGTSTATLAVAYNNGTSAQSVSKDLSGTGAGGAPVYFAEVKSILTSSCMNCHQPPVGVPNWGTTYGELLAFKKAGESTNAIVAGNLNSRLITRISGTAGGPQMGAGAYGTLSAANKQKIIDWIANGALNNPGVTPAVLAVTGGNSHNFGNVVVGTVKNQTFTVSNTGGSIAASITMTGLAAPYTFLGGTFPGAGGTCGVTLANGSSCTVVVSFAPATAAASSDALVIGYNNGTSVTSLSLALSGTGTGAPVGNLMISDGPTHNFGNVANGTVAQKIFTVSNSGAAVAAGISALGLSAPFRFKGSAYPGTGGTCAGSLAAGANCTLVVEFAPTAAGAQTRTLTLTYATSRTATVGITGTGTNVGGAPVYFTEIKAILASSCMTCHQPGGVPSWGTTRADLLAFKKAGETTPAIVPGNLSSRLITRIAGATAGPQMGAAPYGSLSAANKQKIIDWIAAGAPDDPGATPAVLSVTGGGSYNFGNVVVGTVKNQTFTISNTGGSIAGAISTAGLASPYSFLGGAYPGTGGTCGASLAKASSCTIVLSFSPSTTTSLTDTLVTSYNNGSASVTLNLALTGTGVGAPVGNLTISDGPTYNFGNVATAAVGVKTFTVANTGGASATGISATGLLAPFRFKGSTYPGTGGTCGATIAAAQNCTMVVEFAPTASGAQSKTLTLSYNNGSASKTVAVGVAGTGTGGAPIFYAAVRGILSTSCGTCHNPGGSAPNWGITFASLRAFKATGQTTAAILPSNMTSRLITRISGTAGGAQMGTGAYGSLTAANKQKIIDWIMQGALNDPGFTPANLVIDRGPTYGFGSVIVGTGAQQTFTVTNGGGSVALDMTGAGLAAPFSYVGGSYPGTGGTCSATLAATASCTVVVRFAPTTAVLSSDAIEINYNDGTAPKTASRAINGTGTGAPVANLVVDSGPTYDFGVTTVSTVKQKIFTITNSGGAAASAVSVTGLSAPFRFKGGVYPGTAGTCSASLATSASCTIVVEFAPISNGVSSGTITVNYSSGGAKTATRAITGTGGGGGAPVYYGAVRSILTASGCNGCHATDWGTSYSTLLAFKKAPNTTPAINRGSTAAASRFISRISYHAPPSLPQMGAGAYGTLSLANRQKIIDWILAGSPNEPVGTVQVTFQPLLGDRNYIYSMLSKVYGTNATFVVPYTTPILYAADLLGGACPPQDMHFITPTSGAKRSEIPVTNAGCHVVSSTDAQFGAPVNPESSSMREAMRMKACFNLADKADNIPAVLTNANISIADPIDNAALTKAYQQFYPGRAPAASVLGGLSALANEAQANSLVMAAPAKTKKHESWRFVFLALCLSPGWQAP